MKRRPTASAFDALNAIVELAYDAASTAAAATGWVGTGRGTVAVDRPADGVVVFREHGTWTPTVGRATAFANVYRWTLTENRLGLAHLRFGPDRPVELFDLVPADETTLVSADPHVCGPDRYAAELTWDAAGVVRLTWTITGPAKAERIAYVYRPAGGSRSTVTHRRA